MKTIRTVRLMREWVLAQGGRARPLGLVPTMGAFHAGHLSLMRASRKTCRRTVVSLYVNPLQFGPREDLAVYPRNFARDARLAAKAGVDVLFAPSDTEMYPSPQETRVTPGEKLTAVFEGALRPGHFTGVATVVAKLFGIVRPDTAFFGQKDAQQLAVIRQMVLNLNLPVVIRDEPIVREKDGLAMSSRNALLSREERRAALCLWRALRAAGVMAGLGEKKAEPILTQVRKIIREERLASLNYAALVRPGTFEKADAVSGGALLILNVRVGAVRLIDNVLLGGK